MSTQKVRLSLSPDGAAILFSFAEDPTPICDENAFYDISISELRTETGLKHWLDHMRRKNWFTHSVESRMMEVLGK
jgi:hypothetical protein